MTTMKNVRVSYRERDEIVQTLTAHAQNQRVTLTSVLRQVTREGMKSLGLWPPSPAVNIKIKRENNNDGEK